MALSFLRAAGLTRLEQLLVAFLTGSGILSFAVFLLCAAHLALKGVFLALGVAAIYIGTRLRVPAPVAQRETFTAARILLCAPMLIFGLVYVINALAPEVSPDGSAYHLAFVARYSHWHGFRPITTNMYANMPQAMEMLFLFAYAFGRHSAAAMVHLTFLFALVLLMWTFAVRRGLALAGAAAASFVFLSPVFGVDASSAYNDAALAAAGFGCFFLVELWRESRSSSFLWLAGVSAGFAFGLKYTGIVVLAYAVFAVLMARPFRMRRANAAALLIPAILLIAPWLIRSAVVTRNPLSPFFNTWFPNRVIHVSFEQDYSRNFRRTNLNNPWTLPWALAWDGALGGSLGPVFLLLPLGLLCLRNDSGRRLWLAAVAFALLYPLNTGARFLMLSAPLMALLIANGVQRPVLLCALVAMDAVFAWPAVLQRIKAPTCWSLEEIPFRAAVRLEPEETFIRRRMPHYDMARFIEKTVPENRRVLALDPVAEAYTTKTVLVSYESAEGELERDMLLTPVAPALRPDRITRFTFPRQNVRSFRVVQVGASSGDIWSINELSAFLDGQALPRTANWKVRADPWPWETGMAFDGNLCTRWNSWRPMRPGYYFDVEFPAEQGMDRVDVRSTHDFQSQVKLALDLRDSAGAHTHLASPAVLAVSENTDLRRAAVQAVKQRGTDYLMAPNGNPWAAEFLEHQDQWGIHLVGAWGNARLYRLE